MYGVWTGTAMGVVQIATHIGDRLQYLNNPMSIVLLLVGAPLFAVNGTVFFQGWLQTRLASRIGPRLAVAATVLLCVLLFGRMSPNHAIEWLAITLGPSLLRLRTESLLAPMIASAVSGLILAAAALVALSFT